MIYPAYWLIAGFVVFALLFWLALLLWAGRTGHFNRSSEDLRYKPLDE